MKSDFKTLAAKFNFLLFPKDLQRRTIFFLFKYLPGLWQDARIRPNARIRDEKGTEKGPEELQTH